MNTSTRHIVFALSLLLFIGQGCTNTDSNAPTDEPASKPASSEVSDTTSEATAPSSEETTAVSEQAASGITLTATATTDNTVKFEWAVDTELAQKAEGYRFARDTEENPTYPSSWWWERGAAHRELEWKGLPPGESHFRVCAVENDECSVYSNNVHVDVAGTKEGQASAKKKR